MPETIYCKTCKQEVIPIGKGENICPNCHKIIAQAKSLRDRKKIPQTDEKTPKPIESTEIKEGKEEPQYKVSFGASTNLTADEWQTVSDLVNSGAGQNAADIMRKGVHALASYYRMEDNTMENLKRNPKETIETMEDIDKMKEKDIVRRYKELQIKKMEKDLNESNPKPEQKLSEDKLMDQLEKQIRIKSMREALRDDKEDGMNVGEIFKWKLMDKMFDNPGKSSESSAVQALQTQLNSLQEQLRQERNFAQQNLQNEKVLQKLEQFGNQRGLTAQDVLNFTEDKQSAVKAVELEAQKQRDHALKVEQELKMKELEKEMALIKSGKKNDLKDFIEKYKEIKQISAEIGERKKSVAEAGFEQMAEVAKIIGPPIADALKTRIQQPIQQQQMQPVMLPPEPEIIEEIEPAQNPEFQPSDMTETEREMSEQNYNMYIKPSGRKVKK